MLLLLQRQHSAFTANPAFGPSSRQTQLRALADHLSFKLRKAPQHLRQHPTNRRRRVDSFRQRAEPGADFPKLSKDLQKIRERVEGPEILSPRERAEWEVRQGKRDAFVKDWMNGSDLPVQSVQEERLWLRKGIRPLLSGKPDEVLRQGVRACVLDHKYGSYRVEDPIDNLQLAIYALLVSRAVCFGVARENRGQIPSKTLQGRLHPGVLWRLCAQARHDLRHRERQHL
jgi:hypothetical protein